MEIFANRTVGGESGSFQSPDQSRLPAIGIFPCHQVCSVRWKPDVAASTLQNRLSGAGRFHMNIFWGAILRTVSGGLFADRDWCPMREAVSSKQKKMKSASAREL